MRKNQWVVKKDAKWAVRSEGAKKVTSVHATQGEAIEAGEKIANSERSELIVQGRDGRIRSKDSFGPDKCPPKDKEH